MGILGWIVLGLLVGSWIVLGVYRLVARRRART
jgi:hypothetical protein